MLDVYQIVDLSHSQFDARAADSRRLVDELATTSTSIHLDLT